MVPRAFPSPAAGTVTRPPASSRIVIWASRRPWYLAASSRGIGAVAGRAGHKRRAVGIAAGSVHDRIGVSGRDDQRPPVVEDIAQRQDRGLVAAVPVERRGEGSHRLVGQFPFPPQPAGLVDELLELGCWRASKLEASGHIRRKPAPSDKRASIVELTDSGKALADQVKQLWCALAEETVTGLPAETVAELPGVLKTLTGNVDTRRPAAHAAAGTVGKGRAKKGGCAAGGDVHRAGCPRLPSAAAVCKTIRRRSQISPAGPPGCLPCGVADNGVAATMALACSH